MKQKCSVCGAKAESEFCFRCRARKQIPHIRNRGMIRTNKSFSSTTKNRNDTTDMYSFFLLIWNNRPHYSEISNTPLGREISSAFFHHILGKKKHPQAAYDEENIVLLLLDEHSNVESDMYRYEEINRRRELLKTKYDV
jgi:hypothetical protein